MSLTTLFNRVWLLAAAHLTSGEDMADENQGVISDVVQLGEDAVRDVENAVDTVVGKFAGEPAAAVVARVEAVATAAVSDVVAALTHLGTAHNALSSVESSLASEVSTIRALVEGKIIALAKRIAA